MILGFSILAIVICVLVYIMIVGGGPPSGNPHNSGPGGAL